MTTLRVDCQRHILDSSEDYLKPATELANALTNIKLAQPLARNNEEILFDAEELLLMGPEEASQKSHELLEALLTERFADVLPQWGPEATSQKSRELLQALILIDTPAIMGNPSVRNYVEDEILNDPEGNYLETANKLVHILSSPRDLWKDPYLFRHLADKQPSDKLVEVVDGAIEAGQIATVLGDLWSLTINLPPDKLAEIVDRATESGRVAEVVDQLSERDKSGDLTYVPAPDKLAVVVDRLIEAGRLAEMATRLEYLANNLAPDRLAETIDRFIEADQVAGVADGFGVLIDHLPPEKLVEVADRILGAGQVVNVVHRFGILANKLPPDKLVEIVEGAIEADQVSRLLGGAFDNLDGVLPPDKLVEIVDRAIEAGRTTIVLGDLWNLTRQVPPDKLVEVIDRAIEAGGIDDVVDRIYFLSPGEREVVMSSVAKLTPPRLIDIYCRSNMMPITGKGIGQLTSCMELDGRTSLAPAYFREAIRRLPRAEGKPSFAILFKEAMDTYSQIDSILAEGHEAQEMLGRIQATLDRRGPGAERDGIALAGNVLCRGADSTRIETAADAKAYLIGGLNQDLGLELDTSESGIDQLVEKAGDLMPSLVYAASANPAVRTRLAEIITALASDSYHHHKYPTRQPLIEAGILPAIDEAAYQRWQTANTTDSAEVVANTAVDVSDKIRQVVSSALSSYRQLEDFNHLEHPEAKIEAIGAALAQIGQQIGATHRQKQHGEISPEQAAAQVAALQVQKHQLELARDAVRLAGVTGSEVASGKLHNEDGRPTQATIAETLDQLAAIDLGQSSETLVQLREMLDNYAAAATTDIGRIVVSDVDDYQTTIEIGANPVGSCQHYESGSLNQGLLGYFEPGVKIITVRNDNGGLIARAILRLAFGPDGSPAMVLEPTYASQASNDIEGAVKDHATAKAASMGLVLYNSRSRYADVTLPRLIAPYGYSDSFGGLYGRSA